MNDSNFSEKLLRAFSGIGSSFWAFLLIWVVAWSPDAFAFNLSVVDQNGAPAVYTGYFNGVTPLATPQPGIAIGYRWLLEEDVTNHPIPGQSTTNVLAFQFHKSWMPVIATGTNKDVARLNTLINPAKYYIISVVPDFVQDSFGTFFASYNMSAVTIKPNQTEATVRIETSPLVASQIIVFAFQDNHPINGEPDQDGELGLAGFTVRVDDGGGRYGQIGGQVSVDVFGFPLGTTYVTDPTNPSGYKIDPNTHAPSPLVKGNGTVLTGADGYAVIQNLPPGKYGVTLLPPTGTDWIQTSTIEGQHANDAWVKFHEPPYFAEFGPPGPHVFAGFISPTKSLVQGALSGGATITGRITVNHMNRPPNYGFYSGSIPQGTNCWVGLNQTSSNSAVFAAPCNADGTFSIAAVPPGAYTIAVWDTALDLIFGTYGVTVNADGASCATANLSCALGDIPQFTWFNRIESLVFFDKAQTGFPGASPIGIPEVPVTIRFRDGSVDQMFKTAETGIATFNEVFPYFNWQVIEVDNSRFKPTGVTAVVDTGGPVPPDGGWGMPSLGRLTPQPQQIKAANDQTYTGPLNNPNTTNNLSRTDKGNITTQAFQGFTTGTNIIDFGKTTYGPGENGGISGTVSYATVRAEDDPRYAVSEGLEPGIPHVGVIIYRKPATGAPRLNLADIASYTDAPLRNQVASRQTGAPRKTVAPVTAPIVPGSGSVKRSTKGSATSFDYGDAIAYGWTDGWDDNLPSDCQGAIFTAHAGVTGTLTTDCYDGLRNFNQVRPGTYDGHYRILTDNTANPLPAGEYIVEFFAPRYGNAPSAYKIIKEEDKNVFFGVDFVPAQLPPACVGDQTLIDPNQYFYGASYNKPSQANAVDPAYYPMPHVVPPYLSLFQVADPKVFTSAQDPGTKASPLAGQTRPLCMFKDVVLSVGQNAAASVEFYTDVPIAGHFVGIILNDLANEFDITSPNFGEKLAPSWVPIAIRDQSGQELFRIYSDEWGTYSGLVPSTVTASVPIPTGNSPSVMTLCMNDPGPIPDPAHPGQTIIDPHFLKQYSQFCYTLAYLQGTTTYLDTPVLPVAAFVGEIDANHSPLDCDLPDGTPKVKSAINTTDGILGPVMPTDKGPTHTTVLTILAEGATKVASPLWGGPGSATPEFVLRDYGFGVSIGTVQIGSVLIPVTSAQWTPGKISLNVSAAQYKLIAALPGGAGELVITRGDNGKTTVTSVTVVANVTTAQVHTVAAPVINPGNTVPTPISDAIAAAAPGDAVVLPPGIYHEMVLMTKPVQLVGAGAGSVSINPAKTRTDALQNWRTRVQALLPAIPAVPGAPSSVVDLLPGQELNFSIPEPGTLNTEEGAGILVLGQAPTNTNPNYFLTKPSRIDGITIFGADNGGGITANGYVHNLEVSNNRVTSNTGAYGGGIRIGVPLLTDTTTGGVGYYVSARNDHANIHHNEVTTNGGQSTSGGGIQLCTGADNYRVTNNWICGNFILGNGGGVGHVGLSDHGLIDKNTILFNQVFDQSANDNGGGISIASETSLGAGGVRTGTGSVVVSNNIIQGNQAGTGNGGGISLDAVNGAEVAAFPKDPTKWYAVTILNNMVVDNMAALSGGGISLQDVAKSAIVNDTVSHNDSTATAAAAFTNPAATGTSTPQVAGIVSFAHSPELQASLAGAGQGSAGVYALFSNPDLRNDVIYQNRQFYFTAGTSNGGTLPSYTLLPPVATPVYADLGVVGGLPGAQLAPSFCLLTNPGGPTNVSGDPIFHKPYFNHASTSIQEVEPTSGIQIQPAFDEGGNYIDIRFGPLTQEVFPVTTPVATFYNYVPKSSAAAPSPVVGKGNPAVLTAYPPTLHDINGVLRTTVDIGAAQATQ